MGNQWKIDFLSDKNTYVVQLVCNVLLCIDFRFPINWSWTYIGRKEAVQAVSVKLTFWNSCPGTEEQWHPSNMFKSKFVLRNADAN